jgi:hypothetical protein
MGSILKSSSQKRFGKRLSEYTPRQLRLIFEAIARSNSLSLFGKYGRPKMVRNPRKISLAQCVRQGDTTLIIYCDTFDPTKKSHGGTRVCGHKKEIPMSDAIAMFGAETSLSDLPVRCSVCGGRNFNARAFST